MDLYQCVTSGALSGRDIFPCPGVPSNLTSIDPGVVLNRRQNLIIMRKFEYANMRPEAGFECRCASGIVAFLHSRKFHFIPGISLFSVCSPTRRQKSREHPLVQGLRCGRRRQRAILFLVDHLWEPVFCRSRIQHTDARQLHVAR